MPNLVEKSDQGGEVLKTHPSLRVKEFGTPRRRFTLSDLRADVLKEIGKLHKKVSA